MACRSLPSAEAPSHHVVTYSPHWDSAGRPWQGFDCPAQPLRLFGFPSGRGSDDVAVLRVRVYRHLSAGGDSALHPMMNALVNLSARYDSLGRTSLPLLPRWAGQTDSTGHVELNAPPGEYALVVRAIGFTRGEGRVRLRGGHRDSVHAHIHPTAVC